MNRKAFLGTIATAALVIATGPLLAVGASAAGKHGEAVGSVYTMTNAAGGNEVVIFDRDNEGGLASAGTASTGGIGSGGGVDPLASQGSLALTGDKKFLLAVNAGSNDISVFRVSRDGLELVDIIASGGMFPTSLAVDRDLVYVLNAGGAPNIAGFMLNHKGHLAPIAASTRALPGATNSQIGFDPHGDALIVTDRSNNNLLVYPVREDGKPAPAPIVTPSNGPGPFAFAFGDQRTLLVAEVGSNSVSAYQLRKDGNLELLTPSVANGQSATCWIADVKGRYAFTANPGTHSLSSFREPHGKDGLALLAGVAGMGAAPLDLAATEDGHFLYALDPGLGGIDMFRIEHDGSLVDIGPMPAGLPVHAQGIAVR